MGRRNRDREFWESASMNNATFRMYYDRLTELAISMFEWKNIPDTVDPRFLELTLFSHGQAIWFKDEVIGDLALRVATGGNFDVYQIPIMRRAYASNGYNKQLTNKDSVLIYNNYLRTDSKLAVQAFAKRLYNLDRSIDVNSNAQKTPILITCDENQRLTLSNIYKSYEGNEPVIFGDKKLNPNALQVLKTDAPYVADRLYELKTQIWNEALTYLGIVNVSYEKKERLLVGEVERSSGGTTASRQSRLNARKEACEQINKMFGLNIDVEFRDYVTANMRPEDEDEDDDEGVKEDE